MPPSKSDTHITPDRVWDIIQGELNLKKDDFFDPCPVNYTRNGLLIPWKKLNYVNPPYTLLKEFVARAIEESLIGKRTIMLLPSKTDQDWFHNIIDRKYQIFWIRKRLKFKNNKHHATQPHFLVVIK